MGRSVANRQRNVKELPGNFTLSGEWSPIKCLVWATFGSNLIIHHHTSQQHAYHNCNLHSKSPRRMHCNVFNVINFSTNNFRG